MALPNGITTCTATLGSAVTYGGAVASITGTLTADRDIVWAATGQTVNSGDDAYVATDGQTLMVPVPHVDQDGFVDSNGDAVTMWAYTLAGRITFTTGKFKSYTKNFQVLVGQSTLDLDLIPDNATVLPAVVVDAPPVTSVAGLTGAVSAEDLADALSATIGGGYDSGYTGYIDLGNDVGVFLRRVDLLVQAAFAADSGDNITTVPIPEGYRPGAQFKTLYGDTGGGAPVLKLLTVETDGILGASEMFGGMNFTTFWLTDDPEPAVNP